jgi:GNAT superfamily N-acetyltransferase
MVLTVRRLMLPMMGIRDARLEDLPELLRLYRQLAARPGEGEEDPARRAWIAAAFAAIEAQRGRRLLVAEGDGRLAGTLDLLVVTNLTHGGRPWAIVENVVVDLTARRAGVGRALMREAERTARAAGCYKIQLLSARRRLEAHEFYRALGFESSAEGFRRYLITD